MNHELKGSTFAQADDGTIFVSTPHPIIVDVPTTLASLKAMCKACAYCEPEAQSIKLGSGYSAHVTGPIRGTIAELQLETLPCVVRSLKP